MSEKLTLFQTLSVCLALGAVVLIVLGADKEEVAGEKKDPTPFGYCALVIIPVSAAAGAIAIRKMRTLHEVVASFYMNVGIFCVSVVLIAVLPVNEDAEEGKYVKFKFFTDLDFVSWLLVIGQAVSNVLSATMRFSAFKLQEPAKLQVWSFIPRVFQIVVDKFILGIVFSSI